MNTPSSFESQVLLLPRRLTFLILNASSFKTEILYVPVPLGLLRMLIRH